MLEEKVKVCEWMQNFHLIFIKIFNLILDKMLKEATRDKDRQMDKSFSKMELREQYSEQEWNESTLGACCSLIHSLYFLLPAQSLQPQTTQTSAQKSL